MLRGVVRASQAVNRGMAGVAGVALIAIMLVLMANVGMRLVAAPINGTFELVSMCAVLVFGLSLGEAQTSQSHVSIDIVVRRWPKRVRIIVGSIVTVAAVALFIQVITSLVVYGLNLREQGAATDTFGIPFWPSVFAVVIGVAGLVVALVGDLVKAKLAWSTDDPSVDIF